MRSVSVASILGLALAVPADAHASPQDMFGYGARAVSMAGLGGTFVDDAGAVHANPGALSRATERSFTLGFVGGGYSLWTQRSSEAVSALAIERIRATTIGLTLPLPFGGVLRDRVALGLGFYTPTDVVVRGRLVRPEVPQFLVLADRAQSVALQLGVGAHVLPGLRVGVGFAALAAIVGTVVVATDATGRASARVDDQLVASYAPVVGASYDLGPFRLSAVFRGELVARFRITIEARDIGLPLPVFDIGGVAQYDPAQYAFEGAWVRSGWTLAAGTTFKSWSAYPGPLVATTADSPAPPTPGFSNTWTVRAAAERRWQDRRSHWALRGGWFYEPTPAPLAVGRANYLDNDRHAFTFGASVGTRTLGTYVSLDAYGQMHVLGSRTSVKDAAVSATNPGAPSIASGGTLLLLGLAATVTF